MKEWVVIREDEIFGGKRIVAHCKSEEEAQYEADRRTLSDRVGEYGYWPEEIDVHD